MDYNTTREQMHLPEYGRNVQKMVEHLLTIKDDQKRLEQAEVIVDVMATLNPSLKSAENYKHKLWDHLHQIADFELDIEGPFPKPKREEVFAKPEPLPYPQEGFNNRHLGKNLRVLIQRAMEETDDSIRQNMTQVIGYYMKLAYSNWHREPVHDDMIRTELLELTKGQLVYEPGGYKVHFEQRGGHRNNNRNMSNNRNNNNGNKNNKYNKNGNNKNRFNSGNQNKQFKKK
jgi:hypothetical protein